ncbi:hypothetical protein [Thermosulfurimonas sp. F29]|uniref:hypothetical protein n=1 Tax=Thermosulfurimonas sp. F29 TaxID=2867247 RepID=UPI001C830CB3|nr:hypothetical protein [Thermosulfurimonas sp. F29]MBX6423435.1 hypothetical protein [Thermosulfurimonas sp. F29]
MKNSKDFNLEQNLRQVVEACFAPFYRRMEMRMVASKVADGLLKMLDVLGRGLPSPKGVGVVSGFEWRLGGLDSGANGDRLQFTIWPLAIDVEDGETNLWSNCFGMAMFLEALWNEEVNESGFLVETALTPRFAFSGAARFFDDVVRPCPLMFYKMFMVAKSFRSDKFLMEIDSMVLMRGEGDAENDEDDEDVPVLLTWRSPLMEGVFWSEARTEDVTEFLLESFRLAVRRWWDLLGLCFQEETALFFRDCLELRCDRCRTWFGKNLGLLLPSACGDQSGSASPERIKNRKMQVN